MSMVTDLLKAVKDKFQSARMQEIEDRLNIYYDNWEEILKTEVENQFNPKTRDRIKQMLALDSNVLKRVIKEISVVYQKAANRSYVIGEGDSAEEDKRYKELMSKIPVNLIMQENNRLTNLNNDNIVYIVPRNGYIDYDILTANKVEVYQSESNAKEIEALVFTQSFIDTKGNTTIYYIYYDIFGNHCKFDVDLNPVPIEDNPGNVNPYTDPDNKGQTILPFVIFHKDFPIDSIWNATGGNDLVSATKQVGVLLTYFNYLFKVSSFKQLYFVGISIDKIKMDMLFDQMSPFVVDNPGGQIGVVDYQVDLKEKWDVIFSKIGAIANTYGMSLDNFKLSYQAKSGFALKIESQGLDKIVQEQIKTYRFYENELFKKTKIINNTKYPKDLIKDDGIFKIDFVERDYPEAPEEIRKQWSFDIQMGAKSVVDYVMFINPDLKTTEEAIAYIEKNVNDNKLVEEKTGVSVSELLKKTFEEGDQSA